MKHSSSKNEQREELEKQVSEYLRRGGSVAEVARGATGRDGNNALSSGFRNFTPRPKEERTYVPEVVAAIEARRRKPKLAKRVVSAKPRLVRQAVYDDFGEPIRWEWVDKTS